MKKELIKEIPGSILKTRSGKLTSWEYISEADYRIYSSCVRRIIKCKCKCGAIKNVQYNNIRSGNSICCNSGPCKTLPTLGKGSVETSYNSLFDNYKRGAISRGYTFSITKDYFKKLIKQNCYYCGKEPQQIFRILNSKTKEVRAGIPIIYNGIDRLINELGYTVENSVPCCGECNKGKTNKSVQEFISWIQRIKNHLKL